MYLFASSRRMLPRNATTCVVNAACTYNPLHINEIMIILNSNERKVKILNLTPNTTSVFSI